MKPFAFKLEPVLHHREILEDRAKQELVDALQRERTVREEIEHRRSELTALREDLLQKQQHGISIQDLLLFEESIAHRGRILNALSRELEEAVQEVVRRRDILAEASRNRRLLEKLKEKKRDEHGREMARRETIQLDEIALQIDRNRI